MSIPVTEFQATLQALDLNYFTGVPDSVLADWLAYLDEVVPTEQHRLAPNEGAAIALAAGYHLATAKVPVVYLQNSGLGNAINPLTSLADPRVYGIPQLLLIGWRGEPNKKDEPQHQVMGHITLPMLEILQIPKQILDASEWQQQLSQCKVQAIERSGPVAVLVPKGLLHYDKAKQEDYLSPVYQREQYIRALAEQLTSAHYVIATTGKIARELYEVANHDNINPEHNFYCVGSMGHASAIALEVALQKKDKQVVLLDGDGALFMHMGNLAAISFFAPDNLLHVIFDNACHESTGGQQSYSTKCDLGKLAQGCGYQEVIDCGSIEQIQALFARPNLAGPILLLIRIKPGSRSDLGRPRHTPAQTKALFMKALDS